MNLWKDRKWKPMLLKEIDEPFDSDDYIYEIKFDGFRAICYASKEKVVLMSRNGKDMTEKFPELENIKTLVHENVIFDGEIISLDKGKPSFSKMQLRMHIKDKHLIKRKSIDDPVTFIAFDVLYKGKKDLTGESLVNRKKVLDEYQDSDVFKKSKVFNGSGIKLFNEIKKKGLEGIVCKRKKSKYYINKRTDDFIKIKNIKSEEFLVGGYKENKGVSTASIVLGEYRGTDFYYVGKVNISKRDELYEILEKSKKITSPFIVDEVDDCKFVQPKIQVTVEFLEKTKSGHLRHASFKEIKKNE